MNPWLSRLTLVNACLLFIALNIIWTSLALPVPFLNPVHLWSLELPVYSSTGIAPLIVGITVFLGCYIIIATLDALLDLRYFKAWYVATIDRRGLLLLDLLIGAVILIGWLSLYLYSPERLGWRFWGVVLVSLLALGCIWAKRDG